MTKFKRLFAFICAIILGLTLISCSGSGVEGNMTATCSSTSIKINVEFYNYGPLESGDATAFVKRQDQSSSSAYKTLSFSGNDYSKSNCEFTGLSAETEYTFELYINMNEKDELIQTETFKTKSGDASNEVIEIHTAYDLKEIDTDISEASYRLTSDIDLEGEEIILFDSSSTKFEGTFDGNGFKIINYKLKSATASGLFGYSKNATFKNLTLETINFTTTGSKSTSDIGALVGNAEYTNFENINVNGLTYGKKHAENQFSGATSATLNIGGVVGKAFNCSFNNVIVNNASILMSKARKYVSVGLLAGEVSGNAKEITAENCGTNGEILVNCEYSSSKGYTIVGGFIGTVGSTGLIKNCYSNAEIAYSRRSGTGYVNHDLFIGGFLGKDKNAQINISDCISVSDIIGYAGQKSNYTGDDVSDLTADEAKTNVLTNLLATKAYVGGFAGYLSDFISEVKNCAYQPRVEGIKLYAKPFIEEEVKEEEKTEGETEGETVKKETQYVYVGLFTGANSGRVNNCGYLKENKLQFGSVADTTTIMVNLTFNTTLTNVLNGTYEVLNTIDALTLEN